MNVKQSKYTCDQATYTLSNQWDHQQVNIVRHIVRLFEIKWLTYCKANPMPNGIELLKLHAIPLVIRQLTSYEENKTR